jgi:hypothetical protein
MSEHTKGPWKIVDMSTSSQFSKGWKEIRAENGMPIVFCDEYQSSRDGTVSGVCIAEANARLIAAAPDLLEACKATLALGFHGHFTDQAYCEKVIEPVVAKLQAAIAKSEGLNDEK